MDNPYIYILINGSLNMSAGKAAAQAVHALASLESNGSIRDFSSSLQRTVIVLEADNQQQMDNLAQYLTAARIPVGSYIDEGVNEVGAYSVTAMAVGPIWQSDEAERAILRPFKLYSGPKKKRWFNR